MTNHFSDFDFESKRERIFRLIMIDVKEAKVVLPAINWIRDKIRQNL